MIMIHQCKLMPQHRGHTEDHKGKPQAQPDGRRADGGYSHGPHLHQTGKITIHGTNVGNKPYNKHSRSVQGATLRTHASYAEGDFRLSRIARGDPRSY